MKKVLLIAFAASAILVAPERASAHSYDSDDDGHPLRLFAHLLHPVGVALQDFVVKPIHNFVSSTETTRYWFGHEEPEYDPDVWARPPAAQQEVAAVAAPAAAVPAVEPLPKPVTSEDFAPIYFDYDKYNLRADQMSALQADLKLLQDNPGLKVTIQGHTDERGTDSYNNNLGKRRADAVAQYLIDNGIAPSRIEAVSAGESSPAVAGATEDSYAKNRRAVFLVIQ